MSTKLDYLLAELGSVRSQIANQSVQIAALGKIDECIGVVNARKVLGQEPDADNAGALYDVLAAEVAKVNAITVTVPTKAEILAGLASA